MVYFFRSDAFCSTLSALYGKILVVMGWVLNFFTLNFLDSLFNGKTSCIFSIAFPMAEVISTYIPPSFYEVSIYDSIKCDKFIQIVHKGVLCFFLLFCILKPTNFHLESHSKGKVVVFPPWNSFHFLVPLKHLHHNISSHLMAIKKEYNMWLKRRRTLCSFFMNCLLMQMSI